MRTKRDFQKQKETFRQPDASAALDEEDVTLKTPSLLSRVLKRVGFAVLLVLALVFAYVFLLLGEPDEDAKYVPEVKEETILMPMSALEMPGQANVQTLADTFSQPVLSLGEALQMKKARIYDTAFENGYARRVTLTYAFADGTELTVESLRPTAAVTLLGGSGYKLDAASLYTLGGLNAGRMDDGVSCCIFGQSDTAVYAVICPATHAEELKTLLRYTMLIAPGE